MKNQQIDTLQIARQEGIALIVSLIMLLIMTVIGISAMNSSVSKIKMSGSIQQQSFISNSTEESLILGENGANTSITTLGVSIYEQSGFFINQANSVYVQNASIWENAFDGADNNSQYIIEYLGEKLADGDDSAVGGDPNNLQDIDHVYRVTARSISANGTTRMFQSLYLSTTGPN